MKNKTTYFFSLILGCVLMSSCINNKIDMSPRVFRYIGQEYKIESIKYNDTLDSNYGLIYGHVILSRVEDTIQGLFYSSMYKTRLHVLDTNVNFEIDGLFRIKLPVGQYKICIEAFPFCPIVNEIKIKSKEAININYYIDGKWIE